MRKVSQVGVVALGVRGIFLLVGMTFATWTAQLPSIKTAMGLSDGDLAWLLGSLNIGALIGLRIGAWLTPHFGSRRMLQVGMPLFALSLLCIAVAPNAVGLGVALGLFGVTNSVVDVAMNAHGVLVERARGRSVLSGFHAMHSLGMITGALIASLLLFLGVPLNVHMTAVAVVVAFLGLVSAGMLFPSHADKSTPRGSSDSTRTTGKTPGWSKSLLLLGSLAFLVALAEGAANDWATVYLHDVTSADTATAALGYACFSGAMFVGRLAGDRLIEAAGHAKALVLGAALAALCLMTGLLIGTTLAGIIALIGFGFGVSYTLPLLISLGGKTHGLDGTRSVANISTIGYFGFFTGPTMIGLVSETSNLGLAMVIPALSMALAALLAKPVLSIHRRHQQSVAGIETRGHEPYPSQKIRVM
ncbi:MAG: hypothetical protein DI611_15355 [Brachybacterium faecium]|nr:MAG: hypothetical protein DI611_15355 [Brachybacterium faecium]